MDVVSGKDWTEIIPKSYLDKIEEEERQQEQLKLYLPPRHRTVKVGVVLFNCTN